MGCNNSSHWLTLRVSCTERHLNWEVNQHVVPIKPSFPEAVEGVLASLLGLCLPQTSLLSRVNTSREEQSCSAGARVAATKGLTEQAAGLVPSPVLCFPLSVSVLSQQNPQFCTAESSCSWRRGWCSGACTQLTTFYRDTLQRSAPLTVHRLHFCRAKDRSPRSLRPEPRATALLYSPA